MTGLSAAVERAINWLHSHIAQSRTIDPENLVKMKPLGRTGLTVTEICLGTMTWGVQNTESDAHEQLDIALDAGINFIDTAEDMPSP